MRFPIVSRRRYTRDLARKTAELADLNERYAGACIVNTCLTEDLTTAAGRLAEAAAEKLRADHLQSRLDQALGLDDAAVALGASWQARRQKHMCLDKPVTAGEAS